jgi:hypothetical protein
MTMVQKEETQQTDYGCKPKVVRRNSISSAPDSQKSLEIENEPEITSVCSQIPCETAAKKTRHVRSVSDTTGLNLNQCNKLQLISPNCNVDLSRNHDFKQESSKLSTYDHCSALPRH